MRNDRAFLDCVAAVSNTLCEQLDRAHSHHEDCERYGMVV
jgi:hypothetical protein